MKIYKQCSSGEHTGRRITNRDCIIKSNMNYKGSNSNKGIVQVRNNNTITLVALISMI